MHALLFDCASSTLLEFAHNKLGVRPGITTVLHTWSQPMLDHNHLHCIVTGGGLSADGEHWRGIKSNYLFPVRALSVVFAAKYRDGLKALYAQGKLEFHGKLAALSDPLAFARIVRDACRTKWNVYAKRLSADPSKCSPTFPATPTASPSATAASSPSTKHPSLLPTRTTRTTPSAKP